MTVAELITRLQKADPSLKVILGNYDPEYDSGSHGPLCLTIERPKLYLESRVARSNRTYDYSRSRYRESGFEEVPA